MKKTLLLALAAVATIFTSCSSDIINDNDDSNNGQGKGMTLIANVEQDDTRATLTTSDDISGKWSFAYTGNEKVSVGNNLIDKYYTFTNNGANFSCADAKATNTDASWFAYYPGTDIDLTNQKGTEASAADLYALAGETTEATTGAEGLTIKMKAQAAVLRIVKVDNYGPCDIYLKTKDGYVSGLTAKKNKAGFDVKTSTEKVSVLKKNKTDKAGIYYVIVPAGVKIEVWNDTKRINTTNEAGLSAGKYYTLTSGPTSGTATATINGNAEKIEWVQMWIGGPRISVKNASDKMNFEEARKTGDKYIWGKNWCTPSLDEIKITGKQEDIGMVLNKDILNGTYSYKDNKHGFLLTGQQPGYNKNQLFLSGDDSSSAGNVSGKFWLTDEAQKGYGTSINYNGDGENYIFVHPYTEDHNYSEYEVRPVLTIKTVLWGEQNIE